jgi:salicylate hydroxylase
MKYITSLAVLSASALESSLLTTFQAKTLKMGSVKQPCKIAIIGAGIGGIALAIGLLKQGVRCTIYEAAPRFDAVGAGIGLGPNALKAMELMDEKFAKLYDEIKVGNTSPSRFHEQIEILGAEEGFGVKKGWHGGSVGHPRFTRSSAHRKALLEVMKSLIPDGTVIFNKRVICADQGDGKSVTLEFEDGDSVTVDAVVGCDGIKGISRKWVLQSRFPEEVPAKYCNEYVYRGITSMENAKAVIGGYAEDARWFMVEGAGWAMYPISGGREVNIVAFMQDEKPWKGEQVAREVTREEMVSEFKGFDHRLKGLLEVCSNIDHECFNASNR